MNMKAIQTKYHGPTYRRGSRIIAKDADGNRVTVSYDPALNSDDNHKMAALELCYRMKWLKWQTEELTSETEKYNKHLIMGGWSGGVNYHVFRDSL